MKKILVTGATGFIGEHVIEELLTRDCQVIASSSSAEKAGSRSWFSRVRCIPLDLSSYDQRTNLFQYFDHPDLVIHLAWEGLPNYKSSFHIEKNLPAHVGFLTNLIKNGLTDVTITGTCFEYGMKEGCLIEDMPADPANPYAIAKNELRKWLQEYQQEIAFSLKWVRLFYMYGKGQNPNSLLSQLEAALQRGDETFNMSGGEQVRDYLPVEKVAEYIVSIALQQEVTGIINCCSGKPVKVKELVESYLKNQNKKIRLNLGYYPYPDYEPMSFWGDNSKLKRILRT